MQTNVLISICIPAYKNILFLQRLLDSVAIQLFRDFEVIVTDDSPEEGPGEVLVVRMGDVALTGTGGTVSDVALAGVSDAVGSREVRTVKDLCRGYEGRFPLFYYRNAPALGTPENWNEGIRKAGGQWIKIMHDDDWFEDENSLGQFAAAIAAHPESSFIFSAYRDVFLDEGRSREVFVKPGRYQSFLKNKTTLFSRNIVGPPSVVLYKNEGERFFDRTVKWVVDIEFYIRYLGKRPPVYVGKILINVGMGSQQVTRDCFRQRPVEIPENFYLLNKVGIGNLRNMLVYDAWWRLLRNLEIRSPEDISGSGYKGRIPGVIGSMIGWQRRLPLSLLRVGAFSKTLMLAHYLTHYNRIPS